MQSVPRVLFRLCAYEDPETCYLTADEAVSSQDMTVSQGVIVGDESTTVRTRISTISHLPASCPHSLTSSTSRCHYLISLYNPNNYGPVKVTLRLDSSSTSSEVIHLSAGVGTKYTGKLDAGKYMDFVLGEGALVNEGMPSVIRVRSRNGGRSQIYGKVGGKPRVMDTRWSASSLSNVVEMKVDFKGNFSMPLYISVYA
jgi:hypothetical protein